MISTRLGNLMTQALMLFFGLIIDMDKQQIENNQK